MKNETRWSWKAWLERLEASGLSASRKATGRAFARVGKQGKRRWLAAHDLDEAWVEGNTVLADLHALRRQNLLWYHQACFYPILEDPPPRRGVYRLSEEELKLLTVMLTEAGGRGLYFIVRHGYIDRVDDTAPWRLRVEFPAGGQRPADRCPDLKAVRGLLRRQLVETNGCGHGWPFQWTREFRVASHRLYAVGNLPEKLKQYATTDTEDAT